MCHHKAPHRPWQPAPKYEHLFDGADIPEPDNLYDHYEGTRRAASPTHDEGRREHDRRPTSSVRSRPTSRAMRLRKWAYQLYIKDYLRCIAAVDDNVGRVLDYLDAEAWRRTRS